VKGLSEERFYDDSLGEVDFIRKVIENSGEFMPNYHPLTDEMKWDYQDQTQAFLRSLPPQFKRKSFLKRLFGF
jgi:hypothetical protein